jgi:hypothetical protein
MSAPTETKKPVVPPARAVVAHVAVRYGPDPVTWKTQSRADEVEIIRRKRPSGWTRER